MRDEPTQPHGAAGSDSPTEIIRIGNPGETTDVIDRSRIPVPTTADTAGAGSAAGAAEATIVPAQGAEPPDYPPVDPTDPAAATSGHPRRNKIIAAAVGGVVALLGAVYLVDLFATSGTVERNTTVAGVEVGGLTPDQAAAELSARAMPEYAAPITVDVHGVPTAIDPAEAGLTADVAATVEAIGTRSVNPFVRLSSFFTSTERPLADGVDETSLTAVVGAIATETDLAPVEGAVTVENAQVVATAPVIGRNLDVAGAVDAVSQAWIAGGPGGVEGLVLPVSSTPVRASVEKTEQAAAQARTILSAPLTLTGGGTTVEVPVVDIAAGTTFTPDSADGFVVAVDPATVLKPVTPAIEATQSDPRNATISIKDGAPVVEPSAPGRAVDWPAVESAVAAVVVTPNRTVELAYQLSDPTFTTEQANALGIKEVIGEFTTGGFAAASGENIRVVAEKVNGAIVQPHSTFGLNEFTGPRGTDQGYVPAAIIQEGALSTAVGGGISQFATTTYNAAYFAGMGDVTHTPHSFYISRYPAGREATVFDGEIELAFSNDYDTGVLIETIWTPSDITVRLWGTKHVEVESISSDRFNYTSAPVIVKPYGTACSPSGGSSGFSIVNTRVIKDLAGNEIRREDFTTVYNGQQNVICSPPPPAAPTTSAAPAADAPPPAPAPAPAEAPAGG
ncbi:VanW family protein [Nakamurella sp.]|uniref:VanW family protein n=1 Tax=Nakamurella sp. TaxID=1869182 RepID=UPI003784BFCD